MHMPASEMLISYWSSDVCSSDLARERVGGQILKIEIAAGGGKDLAPVDGGEDIRQPADADAGQFIVIVVRHLNARHALERRCDGRVGKLADVLRHDRIDDLNRLLLHLGGALE